MPLRKCQGPSCTNTLPAGATARAKYCSGACRERARYARANGEAPVPLAVVRDASPEPPTVLRPSSRLASLEAAAARLERLLDEADPRSAAPLNKEYRETLREIEALSASGQEGQGADSRSRTRRPFNASAI